MPESLCLVHKHMYMPLQHRFKVRLHFSSCYLNYNSQRQLSAGLQRIDVSSLDFYVGVFDLTDVPHAEPLEGWRSLAAELTVHFFLADTFTFEGGTDGDGDWYFGDFYFQAADFDSFFHNLVVWNIGDDVLIGAYAGRQNLRDVRIGDDGETVIDCAGGGGIPFVCNLAKGHNEGEDSVFVVEQVAPEISRLDASEAKRRPACKTEGVYS
ncbi:hypothetical protein ES707_07983 [subsurface metagenome]